MAVVEPNRAAAFSIAARQAQPVDPSAWIAINNLIQSYALFADHGQADGIATLFTADSFWDGQEIGYGTASGPQAIAAAVVSHFRPGQPMVHLPGPPLVVQTDVAEAEVYSWCTATRLIDGAPAPVIYFGYEDAVRFKAGQWRFRSRCLRLRFRAGAP